MKKITTFTLLMLLVFAPLFQQSAEASTVTGHQMETELNYWIQKNVIRTDSKFNPNKAVTRAEFASYLARALDLPTSTKYTFKDLKVGSNLTIEIQNAAGAGLLSGYPDGTFKPSDKITRQQMAGMIYKAFRYMDLPIQKTDFTFKDSNQISANFKQPVSAAVYLGIIRGDHQKNGVYFKPKNSATIAHAAAFLFRMEAAANLLKPQTPTDPETPSTPPDVDPEIYKVSSISNGQIVPTTALFRTYEDALAVYNASSSIDVIQKGSKIIKMKAGRAFGSQNPKQLTSLYSNSTLRDEVTYVQKGREMKYIGSGGDYVIVELAGTTYYAKHGEVDLVPADLVTGYDYYMVDSNSILTHYTYDNLTKTRGIYSIGPVPTTMHAATYTSLDGVHFTEVGSKKVYTHYPYFQFQSVRQPTSYTAAELNAYIQYALQDRQNTGAARYVNTTTKSKLIGLGEYLKTVEETYRVNAMFILATAIHESDYGMSVNAQTKNNIFGIKVFDSSPEMGEVYATPENSINAFIQRYMNLNYANPLGAHSNGAVPGNKAVGFNVKYASDPNWGSKIAGHMWKIDKFLGSNDYQQARLGSINYTGKEGVNVRTSPEVLPDNKLFTYKPKNPGFEAAFGYPVVIVDEMTGSDGYVWYKILADINPPSDFGWIRSDLVNKID
ncbi:S-layer homology domain-containing protein [Sporosarcina oncorhynchi]|uniref:S-layer homology domain-containing protein n=1 Tax=Sporosarcina oncorhynchi TaxID=3056444 RepID=A0ABZ0L6T9_9BACL|nr:S-layer homology domain-containing protein [Sporosarcina sp. T2O-4]WOV88281.1 S-layer homology domain-containing protein [Sporosarcina sp. T2O-4]